MSEVKFKVGDKVYCPTLSNEILTVTGNNTFWFKSSIGDKMWTSFTNTGKLKAIYNNPSIFPATQEWYDKLVCIYPKLEAPPKRKEPKEIIKAMIKGGWKMIPCCDVNDDRENPPFGIHVLSSSTFETVDTERIIGKLIPFDPKTALEIIDFVDGKCVLENGEVVE